MTAGEADAADAEVFPCPPKPLFKDHLFILALLGLGSAHGGLPSSFWPVESLVAASELLVVGTWNLVP